MIRHIVLLKPKADATAAEIAALGEAMQGLRERLPGILALEFGPSTSPEGLERGFTLGFVVTFADAAARDAYLPDPAHRAVVPLVEAVAAEVLVFDLDVG